MSATQKLNSTEVVCGVNYEGGKVMEHANAFDLCQGALNLQIAMDAPFAGEVAGETLRSKGRSETFFGGYDEQFTMSKLQIGINHILEQCRQKDVKLVVIQIARGRSAKSFQEVISPLLSSAGDIEVQFVHGYRSSTFFSAEHHRGMRFFFLNIGMFARLSVDVKPGEVFQPSTTIDVAWNDQKEHLKVIKTRKHDVAQLPFPDLVLIGIEDSMDFVTPEFYTEQQFVDVLRQSGFERLQL